MIWSSDEEEEEGEEWAPSGDDSSGDESSDDGGGQAAAWARKRKAMAEGGTSKRSSYRGVCFEKGRWRAIISIGGHNTHLGSFDSEEAAARAYDARAKELRGSCVLNFLPDGSLNPDRKKRASAVTLSRQPVLPDPRRPSSYRGVRFDKGRWRAEIKVDGQNKHLGTFDSEEAAARAYDVRAKETRKHHVLNFLPDGSLNSDRKTRRCVPTKQRTASAAAAARQKRTRSPSQSRRKRRGLWCRRLRSSRRWMKRSC